MSSTTVSSISKVAVAAAIVVGVVLSTLSAPAGATTVPNVCTRYVAPGSPTGAGTTAATPMSLASLVAHVNGGPRPGLVACMAGGSYGSATDQFTLTRGGAAGAPVSIIRSPNTSTDVVIAGRLVVARGADHVLLSGLKLIGPGPGTASAYSIDASNVELTGNDISAPNRICISVGGGLRSVVPTPAKVTGFLADGNKVHDCGTNLVKTGSPQAHAFYLEYSTGAVIRNNIISNPVGRGVQLFNDADATVVEHNIFDGNFAAVNFGGGTSGSTNVLPLSENNIVQHNIVSRGVRWCNTKGQCQKALFVQGNHEAANTTPASADPTTKAGATWGNIVRANCVHLPDPTQAVAYNDWEPGYRYEASNLAVDPQYNNLSAGDLRLKATSPCRGKGLRPSVSTLGANATATGLTATAAVRSPWMTATHRLQVRLCATTVTSVTSTVACTGTWSTSVAGSVVGTDVRVSGSITGLQPNRIYEYRWVAWQALLAAPAATADPDSASSYWVASAPAKVRTPA